MERRQKGIIDEEETPGCLDEMGCCILGFGLVVGHHNGLELLGPKVTKDFQFSTFFEEFV